MSATATLEAAPPVRPAPAAAAKGYFQKPLPAYLILATFFAVTLPLAAVSWFGSSQLLLWGYIWLFGMTHFVLTFAVYLNKANLEHFGKTWRNRLLYFALP